LLRKGKSACKGGEKLSFSKSEAWKREMLMVGKGGGMGWDRTGGGKDPSFTHIIKKKVKEL